jgi:hypothetical protein
MGYGGQPPIIFRWGLAPDSHGRSPHWSAPDLRLAAAIATPLARSRLCAVVATLSALRLSNCIPELKRQSPKLLTQQMTPRDPKAPLLDFASPYDWRAQERGAVVAPGRPASAALGLHQPS